MSPHHTHYYGVCADICKACERIGGDDATMRKCAQTCRRCEESCRSMALATA